MLEENIMSEEMAREEVLSWLSHKGFRQSKIEQNEDSIQTLTEALMDGTLDLDSDTFQFNHNLGNPIQDKETGEDRYKTIAYKPKLTVGELNKCYKGVKPSDVDGRILAVIQALTDLPKGIIEKLDTSDYSLAQSIAVFFM